MKGHVVKSFTVIAYRLSKVIRPYHLRHQKLKTTSTISMTTWWKREGRSLTPHHQRCVHAGPRAGVTDFSFDIRYDSCGTVEDLSGQFHENTIVIQYGEDILEAWDEAKRLRCEWLESFDSNLQSPHSPSQTSKLLN
ncbi:hypothetical protein CEXT_431881 [Caerostris extrusa]|uniref:ZP domain-containing protein n=1 Tax=Caerostris extrusa TaxID=172846 RepID=A0AAV4TDF2_CAEEX|nr:hypothetical protein CEXT_431881 [Caerostris extrusa]